MFNRLNQVVRANLGALVDKAEDPDALIAQTVREMESGLKQAHKELVQSLGTSKRLEADSRAQDEEVERWEERAALALRSGDEALAKDALKQKLGARKKADRLRQQAEASRTAAQRMKASLEALEQKTEELKARGSVLAAQVRAAREAGRPEPLGGGSAFDDLDQLTNRVDQLEAEVEASSVLEDHKRAELDARFRELEQKGELAEVDDELAALKRKVEGG